MQKIGKVVQITVSEEMDNRVKEIAEKHGVSRAKIYRNMTEFGLDVYNDLEKIGFGKLADITRKMKELVKNFRNERQLKLFK